MHGRGFPGTGRGEGVLLPGCLCEGNFTLPRCVENLVLQAGVPLGLCIMRWPCEYTVQVEKALQILGRIKTGERLRWERVKKRFEAVDALLALPIGSTASMFLLSAFWEFAISRVHKLQCTCLGSFCFSLI